MPPYSLLLSCTRILSYPSSSSESAVRSGRTRGLSSSSSSSSLTRAGYADFRCDSKKLHVSSDVHATFWLARKTCPNCCNCRVLSQLVVFSSVPLSHCCCHDVPCGNDCAQNFSVEEIRVFQARLVENPSVQVVCFENHAECRFCLAPFWCVAPGRRSGARLAQWRPSVLSFPLVFSLCTCVLLLNIHLDSCDRTQAVSFKTVISTAPSSTGL